MAGPPFASVYFDCDSTLSAIEGVDDLARDADESVRTLVAALTERAMQGELRLEDAYEERLRLLAPGRERVARLGERYVACAVPDAREVVAALRALGKHVGIVSGGLLGPVLQLAAHLGIEAGAVHAVALRFGARGEYAGFEREPPLWRSGGKAALLQSLPAERRPLVFVGDGATDLETQGIADLFVGFGGVAVRPAVRERAQAWFASPSLAPLLRFVLAPEERERLAADPVHAPVLARALRG